MIECLRRGGPRRTELLLSLKAPLVAAMAYLWLGETPSGMDVLGVGVTLCGICLAVLFGGNKHSESDVTTGSMAVIVLLGIAATGFQGFGFLIMKPAMVAGTEPLAASAIRLLGAAFLVSIVALWPSKMFRGQSDLTPKLLGRTILPGFIGYGVSSSLLLYAFANFDAGVAAVLGSLSPVLVLPILWLKEGIMPRGQATDRVRIIPAMVKVQLVLAVLTTLLFVLALANLVTVGTLIVFECLIGITVSAHQPLRMALVPALVPKILMPRAIALDSMVFNLTRMIGPALAGLLIVMVGISPVLLLGAIGNLVLALVIWSLRNDVAKRATSSGSFLTQLRDGWAVICDSRPVTTAFLLTGVFGFGGRAAVDLFPLFAATSFGREADGAGLLLSAAGLGAVCAAAFMALQKELPKHIAEYLGVAGFAALWLMSQTDNWLLGLACAATLGCAASIVGVANQSKIQLSIPDGFHGRIMGL